MKTKYSAFLSMDLSSFKGQWVAISNKKVVSHGKSVKAVYSEAKAKLPNSRPLITKVPDEKTLIF